jgi:hypothetical protein
MNFTPATLSLPVVLALLALAVGGCGSQSNAAQGGNASIRTPARRAPTALVVKGRGRPGSTWRPVATIGGQPAAWIAVRSGVTLLRFDQSLTHLALHAGSQEPGGRGWTYGDRIGAREAHRVIAAFNGGFKLNYGSVGFVADGRVEVPLGGGLGSIVTYRNGTTQIGAWHEGVPARGLAIASVLQNLHLLVDHGAASPTVGGCLSCWGATLGGGAAVARSALGITGNGQLVWASGEHLSPGTMAQALVGAGVVRAVELDINPEWVAGYLYEHHGGSPTPVPVVPGQLGIPGRLLAPYSRDFFTILAN